MFENYMPYKLIYVILKKKLNILHENIDIDKNEYFK